VEEAFEEGQGPHRTVKPMMIIMMINHIFVIIRIGQAVLIGKIIVND
jgi:hypothetical protein